MTPIERIARWLHSRRGECALGECHNPVADGEKFCSDEHLEDHESSNAW